MSTAYMHPHLHMRSYVGSHRSPHSLLRSLTTEQLNAYALQPMETAAAIDWVGSDTAPGPDGHVPGVYKLAKPGMTRILTAFFNLCWSTGRTPSQWKVCHVRMLHKKGDTADVNNYRGISLLDVASKLYEPAARAAAAPAAPARGGADGGDERRPRLPAQRSRRRAAGPPKRGWSGQCTQAPQSPVVVHPLHAPQRMRGARAASVDPGRARRAEVLRMRRLRAGDAPKRIESPDRIHRISRSARRSPVSGRAL